jgi:orotidine-5'-phosphate decarboxylase
MKSAKIYLAADKLSLAQCIEIGRKIGDRLHGIKVHNIVDANGPSSIELLKEHYANVWADFKLHDIPQTVGLRAKELSDAGADIISVHAEGGIEMMMAADEASFSSIYAITALTSLSPEELELVSGHPPLATVLYRAQMAKLAGVEGIVCSPQEVGMLSKRTELRDMRFVTPGIRATGASLDDQKRVGTAVWTLQQGSNILVIGRQLTEASDPVVAFNELDTEISTAGF